MEIISKNKCSEQLPYFVKLLAQSSVVESFVLATCFDQIDFENNDRYITGYNTATINNFSLSENDLFSRVNLLLTRYGNLIEFVSDDPKYFANAAFYFDTKGHGRRFIPQKQSGIHEAKRKKIGVFSLFNKLLQGNVFSSDDYGSKIMLSFFE